MQVESTLRLNFTPATNNSYGQTHTHRDASKDKGKDYVYIDSWNVSRYVDSTKH